MELFNRKEGSFY